MITILMASLALSVSGMVQEDETDTKALKSVGEVMEAAPDEVWKTPDPSELLYIDTPGGIVVVRLSAYLAQGHVTQVKTLASDKFYDGLNFYRVVHGFVAQGGDHDETRDKGAAEDSLVAEFDEPWRDGIPFAHIDQIDGYAAEVGFIDGIPSGRDRGDGKVWLAHCTGAFAFARSTERDTASTEFYITLQPQRYLDRNLTVVGNVIYGMDVVQAMKRGDFGSAGVIEDRADWTPINSIRVGTDVPKADRLPLQVMDTSSDTFRDLVEARSARGSEFFYHRPYHVDLCQMPVPVRLTPEEEAEASE